MVYINGKLDKFTKDNGKMELNMGKVNFNELIVNILGNGKIISQMVMEYLTLKILVNIKDNGFKEIKMETENKYFSLATFIMVNIFTIYNMDMVN